MNDTIIVYKNGDHKAVTAASAWEYANDPDWLCTISLKGYLDALELEK